MRWWNFIFFILGCTILEMTVLAGMSIFGVRPNFLLIIIVSASLFYSLPQAFFLGAFGGLLRDILSRGPFGINAFFAPLWIFFLVKVAQRISTESLGVRVALVFITGIVYAISLRVVLLSLGQSVVGPGAFFRIAFLESLLTAGLMPLVLKAKVWGR